MCLWWWPLSTRVHLDVCLCAQPSYVCELCMCCVFCPCLCVRQQNHLWLIIGMWQKAAGSSHNALMKPGPWLIGDTMVWGNERGSYQTGTTERRGQWVRTSHRWIKSVMFICRTHRRREHPHSSHQNPANAKVPAGRAKMGTLTTFSTEFFPVQSSPFHHTLSSLSVLSWLSKS